MKNILALIGPLAFLCGLFFFFNKKKQLRTHPRYTIGTLIRTGYAISASPQQLSVLSYVVQDSAYQGAMSGEVPAGKVRFLIKFSAKDPAVYQEYKIPIPDSIQAAPTGGWTEPPFPVPAQVLE